MNRYCFAVARYAKAFDFRLILLVAGLAILSLTSPQYLEAQSSPLTLQPSTGKVGIGTTSPAVALHVYNPADHVASTIQSGNGWAGLNIDSVATGDPYIDLKLAGVIKASTYVSRSDDSFRLYTNGADRLVVTSAGYVGIGTTIPAYPLHIYSGVGAAQIRLDGIGDAYNFSGLTLKSDESTDKEWEMVHRSEAGNTNKLMFAHFNGTGWEPAAMTIQPGGNVGIGTTTPTSLLHVNGTFTATSKNFQIDHPLEPDKKHLVHSALEGPEVAVYYRGEAQLENGQVSITLPPYFESLTRKEQRTVQLTPIKGWAPLYVEDEIKEGQFKVKTANGINPTQRFYWEVKAVRADVPPLVVEKAKEPAQLKLAENANVAP